MNLFSARDEVYHHEQKKKVADAFRMTSLLEMEPAINSCTTLLVKKLGAYVDSGRSVDLGAWLLVTSLAAIKWIFVLIIVMSRHYYAFDVVGEFTFNKKLGFLEKGGDVDGIIEAIGGMLLYASLCGQVPEGHRVLLGNPIWPVIMPVSITPFHSTRRQ
jgi:hypothetical protein